MILGHAKWEYDVFRMNNVSGNLPAELTRFGEQGWELVAVLPAPPMTNLIFKRKTLVNGDK